MRIPEDVYEAARRLPKTLHEGFIWQDLQILRDFILTPALWPLKDSPSPWQLIETAPLNQDILVVRKSWNPIEDKFEQILLRNKFFNEQGFVGISNGDKFRYTHWMPLPEMPKV